MCFAFAFSSSSAFHPLGDFSRLPFPPLLHHRPESCVGLQSRLKTHSGSAFSGAIWRRNRRVCFILHKARQKISGREVKHYLEQAVRVECSGKVELHSARRRREEIMSAYRMRKAHSATTVSESHTRGAGCVPFDGLDQFPKHYRAHVSCMRMHDFPSAILIVSARHPRVP